MATCTFTTIINEKNEGNQAVDVEFNEGTVVEFTKAHYPNLKKKDNDTGKEEIIIDRRTGKPKEYLRFYGKVDGVEVNDLNLTMFTRSKADIDKDGNTRAVYEHEGDVYEAILTAIKGKATLKERGDAVMKDVFAGKKFIIRIRHSWWTTSTTSARILDLEEMPATTN